MGARYFLLIFMCKSDTIEKNGEDELQMENRCFLLDGGMGTMLASRIDMPATLPESVNITHPDILTDIHRAYIRAGADYIYANTFGVNGHKLRGSDYTVDKLVGAALRNAKEAAAAEGRDNVKVALDLGPLGEMLEPMGTLTFDEAYELFREAVVAGEKHGADLIVFETFSDLLELKAGLLAAREHTSLPVFCTMTFTESGKTFAGVSVSSAAVTLTALGASAVGINCSLGPVQIYPMIQEMARYTDLPLIVKANAGLPKDGAAVYDIGPEVFAEMAPRFIEAGAAYIGGCCGTTPAYISAIRGAVEGLPLPPARKVQSAVCSARETVALDRVRIVGEQINPSGRDAFADALRAGMTDSVLDLVFAQENADMLDVNVSLPELDEPAVMRETVRLIQSVCHKPLQIDSANPAAMEAGLRACNGRPVLNSVTGEDAKLSIILPLAKKYGAVVVGLTMDEAGLPDTAERRLEIARKIVERAEAFGLRRRDVVIDCLSLPVAVYPDQAAETLKAVALVKRELGVRTMLGISNISFGMPDRERINAAFLTMAIAAGLDLPILNPESGQVTDALDAALLLCGAEQGMLRFLRRDE